MTRHPLRRHAALQIPTSSGVITTACGASVGRAHVELRPTEPHAASSKRAGRSRRPPKDGDRTGDRSGGLETGFAAGGGSPSDPGARAGEYVPTVVAVDQIPRSNRMP